MEKSESAMLEIRDRIKKFQMDQNHREKFLQLRQMIMWHVSPEVDFLDVLLKQREEERGVFYVELP